jgi:hypothetical protein
VNFSELKLEYSEETIGPGLYGILHELSAMIARKYPESIYNDGLSWDSQAIDDICQETVLNQLLGQKQIHYIFDVATTTESVRRLLTAQIKRCLLSRRKKSPIDRLLKRITDFVLDGQIELVEAGVPYYRLPESQCEYQPLDAAQLDACVRAISAIPRLDSRLDTGRESMIYTPNRLKTFVETLFQNVEVVSEKELRNILEVLLTPWAPRTLVPIEKEYIPSNYEAEDSIEEEQMVTAARSLANSFTHVQRVVLILKSQNYADAIVASEIGVSRPTVADMKKSIFSRVGEMLVTDLPAEKHERAMQYLLEECNVLVEGES